MTTVCPDERLDAIVVHYLRALDAGQTPDRQAILSDNPDLKTELEAFFDEEDRLHGWAGPFRSVARAARVDETATAHLDGSGVPPDGAGQAPQTFGDYEVLEEIAAGGMGVVYKARHCKLNRLVALKMIRAGARAPAGERQRFRNEAEAVAQLDHTDIVPVYDVGEQEGVPYFSMKLIEGGSLAVDLEGRRTDPRGAARLLARVARAIHYAHQRGILHRDLKPSNILLDAGGGPHVSDFGLAKRLDKDGSGELTRPGDIVGTPGYMAPEQASFNRGAVTTATDVYGLGALLYALLTGGPPFRAEDPLATLECVRTAAPQPPSKTNPAVPRDLELICLKCLEKEPQRRYAGADTLAGELERFLEGDALLHTRPVGNAERLWRWCRRNRAVASLVAGIALALIAIAGVSLGAAVSLKAANDRERASRARAEENHKLAIEIVHEFFNRLKGDRDNQKLTALGLQRFRREFQAVKEKLLRLQAQEPDDPAVGAELGRTYLLLGRITESFGSRREAEELYQKAQALLEPLAQQHPEDLDYQGNLAQVLHQRGNLHQFAGRKDEALAAYERALSLREGLSRAHPETLAYQEDLARTLFQIGRQHQMNGQPGLARETYLKVLPFFEQSYREHRDDPLFPDLLARVLHNLGDIYVQTQPASTAAKQVNEAQAIAYFQRAIALEEVALESQPNDPEFQDTLAQSYQHLGILHRNAGRPELAAPPVRKALDLRERLVRVYPAVPDFKLKLATVLHSQGLLDVETPEKRPATRAMYERALSLCSEIGGSFAGDAVYREETAKLAYDAACCYALSAASKGSSAQADAERAIGLLHQARDIGFFKASAFVARLATDPDFTSIRSRPDFKALAKEQAK